MKMGERARLWSEAAFRGTDCLSRLHGVATLMLTSEQGPADFAYLAAKRPARAAKAFDAALKRDPSLSEARVRAARIRSLMDGGAVLELERIAEDRTEPLFASVAALSRAEVAVARHDAPGAFHWFDRSVALAPRQDLPSTYRCTVLTPEVEAELSERMRKLAAK